MPLPAFTSEQIAKIIEKITERPCQKAKSYLSAALRIAVDKFSDLESSWARLEIKNDIAIVEHRSFFSLKQHCRQ